MSETETREDGVDGITEGERDSQVDSRVEGDGSPDFSELRARLELLKEENRRLRDDYIRSRKASYRYTAIGFLLIGIAGSVAAVMLPDVDNVLYAVSGTGFFASALVYFLTPETFVSSSVAEMIYQTYSDNLTKLASEIELESRAVYVPVDDPYVEVKMFVPWKGSSYLPDNDELGNTLVLNERESRGVSVQPVGNRLFEEFRESFVGELPEIPEELSLRLSDGVVEKFEFSDAADVETDDGVVEVGFENPRFGRGFDNPLVSFFAVGLAFGLEDKVEVETKKSGRYDYVARFSFGPEF
ncbi:MAG: hypothetical protein ABEK59_09205 [Halobacteria archaeon]